MPRARWLVLLFLVVFLASLIATIPASLLVSQVPAVPVAGAPLALSAPTGTVWRGGAVIKWRKLQGALNWQLGLRGLSPGLSWTLDGDVRGHGWLSPGPGEKRIEVIEARVPASLIDHVSPFTAEGSLGISGLVLALGEQSLVDAAGDLRYSGGRVSWSNGKGDALLPAISGKITRTDDGAVAQVTDDSGTLMMDARVREQLGEIKVYRAWPALLGVSQGGDPADVVFEASQPLWQ